MSESLKEFQRMWLEVAERGLVEAYVQFEFDEIHREYMTLLNNYYKIVRVWRGLDMPRDTLESFDAMASRLTHLEGRMNELVAEYAVAPVDSWQRVEFEDVVTGDLIRLVSTFETELEPWTAVVEEDARGVYFSEKDHFEETFYSWDVPDGWRIERYVGA